MKGYDRLALTVAAVLLFVFGLPCLVFALAWLGVLNTHRTLVEGLRK